jgi:hypothetical protein
MIETLRETHARATRALAKAMPPEPAPLRPGQAIAVGAHPAGGRIRPPDAGRLLSLKDGSASYYSARGNGIITAPAPHVSALPERHNEGDDNVGIRPLTLGDHTGPAVVTCPTCGITGTLRPEQNVGKLTVHTVHGALGAHTLAFSDRATAVKAIRAHYALPGAVAKARDATGHVHGAGAFPALIEYVKEVTHDGNRQDS